MANSAEDQFYKTGNYQGMREQGMEHPYSVDPRTVRAREQMGALRNLPATMFPQFARDYNNPETHFNPAVEAAAKMMYRGTLKPVVDPLMNRKPAEAGFQAALLSPAATPARAFTEAMRLGKAATPTILAAGAGMTANPQEAESSPTRFLAKFSDMLRRVATGRIPGPKNPYTNKQVDKLEDFKSTMWPRDAHEAGIAMVRDGEAPRDVAKILNRLDELKPYLGDPSK
tara:strand:+ start:10794 stop:11477 length:684 start_codon:yes stop_codon:yes gene_type:complete